MPIKFGNARMLKCRICHKYKLFYDKHIGNLTQKQFICKSCKV